MYIYNVKCIFIYFENFRKFRFKQEIYFYKRDSHAIHILCSFIYHILLILILLLFMYKKTLSDLKYTFSCIFIRSMFLFMILVVRLAPLSIPSLHIVRDHHEIY